MYMKANWVEGGLEKVMSPMQATNDYSVTYLLMLLSLIVLRATVSELVDAVCKYLYAHWL